MIPSSARIVANYQIDASLKPVLEHFVGTVRDTPVSQPHNPLIDREEIVVVKKKASASFTAGDISVRQTIVQNFTTYGEKVKVTLPAACKGKSVGSPAPASYRY